jgi:hypothetical protein
MQLSIKIPSDLTLPLLEKCAVLGEEVPSRVVADLALQCVKWMDTPHREFRPLKMVRRFYIETGRQDELGPRKKAPDELVERYLAEDEACRFVSATEQLKKFRASLKRKPAPKQLHLKISQGMGELPQRIKAKADWLRMTPNAFVVACLRHGLEAMDSPAKALVPPPIVFEFWSVSHAESHRKVASAADAMVMETLEPILRKRSGPILDTVVRYALREKWDVTLREIMRDADALSDEWMPKD